MTVKLQSGGDLMAELIRAELKKICRRKLTIIVTSVCFLLTVLFFLLPFIQYVTWDVNGNRLSGSDAVSYRQERYNELSGALTEERIESDIQEYQDIYSDPENLITEHGGEISFTDEIYYGWLAQRTSYLNMIGNTYEHNEMGYLNIPSVSGEDASRFYEVRNENVTAYIESNSNLSNSEKEYWTDKNSQITEPYEYGYPMGWSIFGDTFQMLVICILGICIAAAPVFAGEYQSGADSVILSTRFGKSKLVWAKLISVGLFGTVVFAVNATAALLLPLITFGFRGGDLPLQIMDSFCPYSLTFSQASFILIGIAYLVMLALLSVTLLCSAKMKTPFGVLVVDVVLIFLPLFLQPSSNDLWQHIFYLLPSSVIQGLSLFKLYLSYDFGFTVLNLFSMTILIYAAAILLCVLFAQRGFKKHQVK